MNGVQGFKSLSYLQILNGRVTDKVCWPASKAVRTPITGMGLGFSLFRQFLMVSKAGWRRRLLGKQLAPANNRSPGRVGCSPPF